MKFKNLWVLVIALALVAVSCGDDDKPEDPVTTTDDDGGMNTDDGDSTAMLDMERDETVSTLTQNGEQKVWKISQATLNNDNGSFDISTNFNVVDDEFVFSGTRNAGSLEWRPGNGIAVDGADAQGALLDFYLTPENSSFAFDAESSSSLTALDGRLTFTVVDDNSITGTLSFPNGRSIAGETIDLSLTEKTSSDYAAPQTNLAFSEVSNFMAYSSFGQQHNVGFAGSNTDNSLYIAYRNDNNPSARSRILKYDIDAGSFTERNDTWTDFFTRKLDVVNNELILTGGQNIYTYDLDLSSEPEIVAHGAGNLSRFSTSALGNEIYVVGGDLDATADKLRKINSTTGALDIVSTMPLPKVHAGSVFVNENLYIFGGRGEFFENSSVTSESFIYDTSSGSYSSFQLPVALNNSYAARKDNLIYIVGDTQIDNDNDGTVDDFNVWTGVYDTLDASITEIPNTLDDSDQFSFVHSMTIFNNKLYVIYGSIELDPNGGDNTWQILSADLN